MIPEIWWLVVVALGLVMSVIVGTAIVALAGREESRPRGEIRTQYIIYDYAYVGELIREVERLKKRQAEKEEADDD